MDHQDLAKKIARAEPTDRVALVRLHEELRSICAGLGDATQNARERFAAAVVLTRLISNSTRPVSSKDLAVVAGLLRVAAEELRPGAEPPAQAAEEARAEVDSSQGPDLGSELRLASDLTLGDVLLRMKTIGRGQLEHALREQVRSGERLGTILVREGMLTHAQLDKALQTQVRMRNDSMRNDSMHQGAGGDAGSQGLDSSHPYHAMLTDCLMGELLLQRHSISEEQLERALGVQRATGLRIGEALVETGATSWDVIQDAIELQSIRRAS